MSAWWEGLWFPFLSSEGRLSQKKWGNKPRFEVQIRKEVFLLRYLLIQWTVQLSSKMSAWAGIKGKRHLGKDDVRMEQSACPRLGLTRLCQLPEIEMTLEHSQAPDSLLGPSLSELVTKRETPCKQETVVQTVLGGHQEGIGKSIFTMPKNCVLRTFCDSPLRSHMCAHEHMSHERQPLEYNKHHHNTPTTGLVFLILRGCPSVHGSSWCQYI